MVNYQFLCDFSLRDMNFSSGQREYQKQTREMIPPKYIWWANEFVGVRVTYSMGDSEAGSYITEKSTPVWLLTQKLHPLDSLPNL